ncbi:hypothetical protein FKX85_20070 [Echinicola soli]|uniref:Uncharacterized protein n=1 Tax=Echinicola soli TaxID=2591634 RepID=A0A514CN19_9BACT|nr:hypothetical protein [Echinicola soli]QDH81201.1 hypothetical protein FKX85_20070 [Echinicola soli]
MEYYIFMVKRIKSRFPVWKLVPLMVLMYGLHMKKVAVRDLMNWVTMVEKGPTIYSVLSQMPKAAAAHSSP